MKTVVTSLSKCTHFVINNQILRDAQGVEHEGMGVVQAGCPACLGEVGAPASTKLFCLVVLFIYLFRFMF